MFSPATASGLFDPRTWPEWLLWVLALYAAGVLVAGVREAWRAYRRGARETPLVSFLLIVKDEEKVVEGALRRLVGRHGRGPDRGPDCEVVVVDDCSVDDTPRILRRLERRYGGFVRLLRLDEDQPADADRPRDGLSALEQGLRHCRGRVALVVDIGDLASPRAAADVAPRAVYQVTLSPGGGYRSVTEKQVWKRAPGM